jgi:hypothetical protein
MSRGIHVLVVLAVLSLLLQPAVSFAVETLKARDVVEVLFLGSWQPGTVVKPNFRGMVIVDYEFAGANQQGPFRRDQVRLVFEMGAMCPPRSWKNSEGNLVARAVVASIDGEKATLLRSDMKRAVVSISSLSEADQKYLKDLQEKQGSETAKGADDNSDRRDGVSRRRSPTGPSPIMPALTRPRPSRGPSGTNDGTVPVLPPPPKLPSVEKFAPCKDFTSSSQTPSFARLSSPSSSMKRSQLAPDPLPKYFILQQGAAAFARRDFFDERERVVPIGGNDSLVLASVQNRGTHDEATAYLVWASLAKQQVVGQQLLPPGEVLLDYFPPAHRLLTYTTVETSSRKSLDDATLVLTLWEVLPNDKQVKPIVRWDSGNVGHGNANPHIWARLVNGNIVVQVTESGFERHVVAWNAAEKKMLYCVKRGSHAVSEPTISGGRKYLFIPNVGCVNVLEAATGQQLLDLPAENALAVAVSEDGRRAAVLGYRELVVWDLAAPDAEPQRYPIDLSIPTIDVRLDWVNQDRLTIRGAGGPILLFSLPHKVVVWSYQLGSGMQYDLRGGRGCEIALGHLLCLADIEAGFDRPFVVRAMALPGPKVDASVAALNPDSLLAVKSGTAVRLDVQAGVHNDRVRAAMERKIAANGWKLDAKASITVLAAIVRESQTVTYRSVIGPEKEETATATKETSLVEVQVDGKQAWVRSAEVGGTYGIIEPEPGETLQDYINRNKPKPDVDFFDRVTISDRIIHPDKKDGIGASVITARGLVPK